MGAAYKGMLVLVAAMPAEVTSTGVRPACLSSSALAVFTVNILPNSAAAASSACPRCGATTTERISEFGSTACKASYRCRECLEPFEYFKCI